MNLALDGFQPVAPRLWTPDMKLPDVLGGVRDILGKMGLRGNIKGVRDRGGNIVLAGFGDAVEVKILDHIYNDGAYAAPTPFLALTTAVPAETETGATLAEANYTGYARVAIAATDMSAAAAGSKTNSAVLTFPNCTAGSATVLGWAVVSAGPARLAIGDVIVFGSATSTNITTTQTPPTVAAGGLVTNLD